MAVSPQHFKSAGNGHRALVQRAERHLAKQLLSDDPNLSDSRALAQATRQLAAALGVSRSRLVQIRQIGQVPSKHWFAFERATGGKIKAVDFERANHE